MQNFRINEYGDDREELEKNSQHINVDLGDRIHFINCASGLLIAEPADSDDPIDYMVPVCLGYGGL